MSFNPMDESHAELFKEYLTKSSPEDEKVVKERLELMEKLKNELIGELKEHIAQTPEQVREQAKRYFKELQERFLRI